ncbi:MAG: leucine-rich repeat domain-containing protein [Brasilonema octagenarum HA4186-MV1]|jgi:Leucine-rich repeat (LRR) protein|nr:leucine-rich repeat domain-containing protein [Brasilonema octagenarum HA4186-MV1]
MTQEELLRVIEQAASKGATELDLSGNELTVLPPSIGKLTQLKKLILGKYEYDDRGRIVGTIGNNLSALPAEIGQLHHLEELQVVDNRLSSLPAEFGQLTNLQTLDLWDNQLSALPAEFGQLTNLRSLDLSYNQLSALPQEFGQLTNLQTLDLSSNRRLSALPQEFGQLTNLQTLDLSSNQLSALPAEFGQLTNLQTLHLISNQLSALPAEFGQLINLQTLDLRDNQLDSLPKEIGRLTKLTNLELDGNPLESPPPEIREKGSRAILDFYRQQLEQETDYLYEAKLLIVGEGGAGKTTLAKKIQDQNYQLQQDEISTEGIDVIQWKFPLSTDREFQVNIWDFGGQEIYHATHQFFLTKRSLYVLVADTRKEDTDFYYWLKVVELLSGNSPLLIIKNEKQDRKREINERELRGEFTNFKETLTTNLATNRGLPEILNQIKFHIQNLPHVGTELPKTWVKVREALEHDPREYISLEEYLTICQQYGFTTKKDKLQLSGYLHDLGVCLHFQDDSTLKHYVILKPEWGTTAVYKVLDNDTVRQNQGRFTQDDLVNIWNEVQYADMRDELLLLMMRFKLCYQIPSRPDTYIAPQLLSVNQPDYTWDETNNLILRYKYEFMPKGILTRFIVETHFWIEQQKLVWKNGVVLNKDQTRAEVIENYNQREIKIRVAGNRKKELLAVVTHELEKIHQSFERLQYQTFVPCNCASCKGSQTPYAYPLDALHKRLKAGRKQIECENSFQMVDVRKLIDDVMYQSLDADRELKSEPAPLQEELEQEKKALLTPTRNLVFISYSHKDQKWFNDLKTHLEPSIREKNLQLWDDTQIQPGAVWRDEIANALAAAKVALLLVSPHFLDSDFISKNELPPLLENAGAGVTILWVPLRSSNYKETAIEKYQAAHSPEKPLKGIYGDKRDRAWVEICKKIKTAANL